MAADLRNKRRAAFANAYRALGTLAYNSGNLHSARQYLRQAFLYRPQWLTQRSFLSMLVKATLSPRVFTAIRATRMRLA
ncbi:MAG: hypothetical protein R2867_46135 [Caldilineaceae bacterium]